MNDNEKKEYKLNLYNKNRSYRNTFKKLQFYYDGEDFIFYGEIKPIKWYGKNLSIQFINPLFKDDKPLFASIYITENTIESYRLKRMFKESIKELERLQDDKIEHSTTCYFVGSYPKIKSISKKDNSTFNVFNVDINNLDHLVTKFTTDDSEN